jgi:hypothetical protein
MHQKGAVRDMFHRDAIQILARRHDRFSMRRVGARHGRVTHDLATIYPYQVDRADACASLANRAGNTPERTRLPLIARAQ